MGPSLLSENCISQLRPTICLSLPQVRSDRDKFTIYLDVKHFSPDDLTVKVTEEYVEIQGKHGERQVILFSPAVTVFYLNVNVRLNFQNNPKY